MSLLHRKTKSRVSVFFLALLVLSAGHMFFLSAGVAQAYAPKQAGAVHFDVVAHENEDEHTRCSVETYQRVCARASDSLPDIHDLVFDNQKNDFSDFISSPDKISSIIYDESVPPRLPLALKTQLLI